MAEQRRFHEGEQHPEEWREDLNPDNMAGMNYDLEGPNPEIDAPTAFEKKELHEKLEGYNDDELRRIPILPEGSRLEQGATYIDLKEDEPHEFNAMAGMEAGPDNWYVPKDKVGYQLWNRLIGVENPERIGEADER
ncbi:MAG: hypothetical protein M3220_04880 [Chloroflexota bacterium]|nr:hypothetical protein [Chloroflexota bacterium]